MWPLHRLHRLHRLATGQPMKLVESERYLGEEIGVSLSQSVYLTVLKRQGLVKRLISEIKVTVEDFRSNVTGGLVTGLEIWRLAVIPFLYSNSQCWVEIPKKAIKILNHLQNYFFTSLFRVPTSCPVIAYLWDTATLTVDNFIMMRKLLFYHHLLSLPDSSLAKEVVTLQKELGLGLASECEGFLSELSISCDPSSMTK